MIPVDVLLLANPRQRRARDVLAGNVSHWLADIYGPEARIPRRPPLSASREADVCIVGGGYTGLWTAYELRRADPSLAVVVLEAHFCGFGASGRNGGAVIAQLNGSREYWSSIGGSRDAAIALERAVQDAVDQVGRAVERERIKCAYRKNGVLIAARSALELDRLRASVEDDRAWGMADDDSLLLSADEARARIAIQGVVGAKYSPHCASVHPGRLVRGLADAAVRAGATIYEDTPVDRVEPGAAHTASGSVRAKYVIRATEAYTQSLETHRRVIVPVHTSMLVTEALPPEARERIAWHGGEALLAEHPFLHLQYTADGRITIGGDDPRVPYRYGSRPDPMGPAARRVYRHYHRNLVRLFPVLREVRIERSWQGIFGASRSWSPRVGLDPTTGLGWASGYVGEGVAASNLAGRTLRDLVLGRDSELTRLPWVGREGRRWEPEPLRTIGAGVVWAMRALGDDLEARRGRQSRLVNLGNRLAGFTGHLG